MGLGGGAISSASQATLSAPKFFAAAGSYQAWFRLRLKPHCPHSGSAAAKPS